MGPKKRTGQPTAFDAPPVLTGKRKRATVSYVEVEGEIDAMGNDEEPKLADEIITNDSDEDEAFTTGRKKVTRAPPKKRLKKTPKAKEPKRFRFLDLPPELRDMIYEMALFDHNEVSIVVRTRAHRQKPLRGPVYIEGDYNPARWNRRRYVKSGSDELSPISTMFVPALLALNKQINAEAINYLYGHEFTFENCFALTEFLAMIGLRNQQRLHTVKIVDWGSRSAASKLSNHTALTMLAGATNLESLVLDCAISGRTMSKMAKDLYRDGHHFLAAFGAANGGKDAAVDIIEVNDINFPVYGGQATKEEQIKTFQKHLRALAKTL